MPDQFAVPMRLLANGQLATNEQGTPQELADRVNVLCRTPPGWLDGRPGFGLAEQRFRKGGADLAEVSSQIDTWVPDANEVVAHNPTVLDAGLDYLGIQVAGR